MGIMFKKGFDSISPIQASSEMETPSLPEATIQAISLRVIALMAAGSRRSSISSRMLACAFDRRSGFTRHHTRICVSRITELIFSAVLPGGGFVKLHDIALNRDDPFPAAAQRCRRG